MPGVRRRGAGGAEVAGAPLRGAPDFRVRDETVRKPAGGHAFGFERVARSGEIAGWVVEFRGALDYSRRMSTDKPRTRTRTATPRESTGFAIAVQGAALNDAAERRYARVWTLYRRGVDTAEIASRTGIALAEVEEFELVGLPSSGLPALLERERMKLRAAMAVEGEGERELERRAAAATTAEEVAEVRVAAAKAEADRTVRAISAGVASKSDEARLAKANRTTALALASLNANLLKGAVALSEVVGRELAKSGSAVDVAKALRALTQVSSIAKTTAETARIAVQLERLAAGEPTSIVGHVGSVDPTLADMTPEEGQKWLEIANKAFARRALRATVIDGAPLPEFAE